MFIPFIQELPSAQDCFLVFFELFIVISALGVVLIPNLVYSAFLLALVLVGMAVLYVLLNAEFLAAAQILVYVGAINVLILFAVMLVNTKTVVSPSQKPRSFRFTAIFLSLGFFGILLCMIGNTAWAKPPFLSPAKNFLILSNHLFSDFLLPFEIVSLILLIALIGAVLLARKDQLN